MRYEKKTRLWFNRMCQMRILQVLFRLELCLAGQPSHLAGVGVYELGRKGWDEKYRESEE